MCPFEQKLRYSQTFSCNCSFAFIEIHIIMSLKFEHVLVYDHKNSHKVH